MIISSGLGMLAIGVPVVACVLSVMIEGWVRDAFEVSPPNSLFMSLMTVLPFVGFKALDVILKKCKFVEREKDENGNTVLVPVQHSLYFIPLSYLPYLWLLVMLTISIAIMV